MGLIGDCRKKNGLGLKRSGPAGKRGGFFQGGIGRDSQNDREKSQSGHTGVSGPLGHSFASKPINPLEYGVDPEGRLWWKRNERSGSLKEAIDGCCLLEPISSRRKLPLEISSLIVSDSPRFESGFPLLKSCLEVLPVDHCRAVSPVCAIPLGSFSWPTGSSLASQAQWISKGFHRRNPSNPSLPFKRSA